MVTPPTVADIDAARLLHHFFEASCRRAPDALALDIPIGPDGARQQATYAELAAHTHVIQRDLSGVVTGEGLVALLLPRTSVATYAAQLAVMRSGAAYVSLDPALPDARLADIIADADPVAILTDMGGAERAATLTLDPATIIVVSGVGPPEPDAGSLPPAWLGPNTLAYVIYTSGTTGRPKGVMIEHGAITNLIASDLPDLGMRRGDRVAQTSSHVYDSSVEEIWIALAAGATLVVASDDAVRAGPDVLTWLEDERITVWCPSPTLLRATGCRRPDATPQRIRLVYVGGEAMPSDVVSVWAPGRRLVNGYGPTECAVVATRAEMAAERPISIGWPIANNHAHILAASNGHLRELAGGELAAGERGELCLGGTGLARGYWRAPELTAAKFIDHAEFGRLYRTGDLASCTADGELFCYGRRDSQVKIRGHRVELEDVESHLAHLPGVRAAACAVRGHALAALFVATDPEAPPSLDVLASAVSAELPSHMVPVWFAVVDALPITAGGKLDRPALPAQVEAALAHPAIGSAAVAPPANHLEALILSCAERVLTAPGHVRVDADFFDDLGADSLGAAELVTALREHDETASLTVRDIYEAPTVRGLAERAAWVDRAAAPSRNTVQRDAEPSAGTTREHAARMTALQVGWLVLSYVPTAAITVAVVVEFLPWLMTRLGLLPFLLSLPVLAVVAVLGRAVAGSVFAVAVKRQVIGRYTARNEPVWSTFHFQSWLVQRAVGRMPWRLVEGTELQSMLLRALGARVGRRVHLHRGVDLTSGGWDLLSIGDDVTLNQDASLRPVEIEDGRVVAGPITIDDGATIEVRAGLGPNTHVGRGATLTALSSLPFGARMPDGERWSGVPAAPDGASPPCPTVTRHARELTPLAHAVVMIAVRLGTTALLVMPTAAVSIALALAYDGSASSVLAWLATPEWTSTSVVSVLVLALTPLPLALVLDLLLARALGRIGPGVISRWSLEYVRVWTKSQLVNRSGPWLSGALAWRSWLRGAGASVGPTAEVSTIIDVIPEHLSLGAGTFLTDGIYLGGPRVDRGTVTMAPTRLGERVFIGNHAVVPCGQDVPDDVLIGVCTVADQSRMRPRSAWFGHPAFVLARRPDEIDQAAFTPTWPRYLARLFFEAARFALPVLPLLVGVSWFSILLAEASRWPVPAFYLVVAPAVTLAAGIAVCLLVVALKWLLLGRVRPDRHEFWSCWCFRWDLLYVAWQQLAQPILSGLEGSLLLAWYLRAMGARIGKRVILGRGFAQVVDPDMLHFEDDATVRGLLQAHTFEARVLKIDRVHVGRGATVGSQALLFYGTHVGAGTRVAAHSVVMKRERLPPGRAYEGCPTRVTESPGHRLNLFRAGPA